MIDLSPFKIGDKLITRDNDRVKVVFLSESQMITEDEDGSGCLNMYKLDGTCIDRNAAGNFCSISDIVSRHDPRHWLKDGELYQFTIGGLNMCVGMYIEHRKSFMNCGNKVCGVSEAKDIVRLTQEQNGD